MFTAVTPPPGDRILAVMQAFRADTRADKIDLCVGVYLDETGHVPILPSVKAAERRVVEAQTSKTYVSPLGDARFCDGMQALLLGRDSDIRREARAITLQTPGGSGALRVAADFVHRHAPRATVWMSAPTWANHAPICHAAGLAVAQYPYWDPKANALDFDAMVATLGAARPGDILLLHACCHNPTGVDPDPDQWRTLADLARRKSLLPLVDCAYQGFARGLDADVAGLRLMAAQVPEMLIAQSCSKSFGLYRERCGALSAVAGTRDTAERMRAALGAEVRTNYSMPPAHGAEIVAMILGDPDLRQQWESELAAMRDTIASRRRALRAGLEARQLRADMSYLTRQSGMFSCTGFDPGLVTALRRDHGIYLSEDGRVNVAGVNAQNVDALCDRIASAFHRSV